METASADRPRLKFTQAGEGLPLVLVHGFPVNSQMWTTQVAELSHRYRVIAPDIFGFGASPVCSAGFTINQLAADMRVLLQEIGALPCVFGGLSMGGYVPLAFARQFAADLKGLILLDTRADADAPAAREGRQKMIDLVREKGASAVADQMIPKLLAPGAADSRPDMVRAIRQMAEAASATAIEHAVIALRDRLDSSALLPELKVPTLIVVGDGDQITPPAIARGMHEAIVGSRLAVIRGAGHMSPLEQPVQVNQAVSQFLQAISK